jgi:DNA polymerase
MKINIDFETRSDIDLSKCGLSVYVNSPHTDILCMAYKIDGGPTQIWKRGEPFPKNIDMSSSFSLKAQNAPFEFAVWNTIGVKKYGFPPLPLENVYCTMVMAFTHGLPGSLEKMAPALGIEKQKDMAGSRVMLQLSKPRKINEDGTYVWYEESDSPEKFETLYAYCIQDVEVEYECEQRMRPLSAAEREIWLLDQKINNRGIQIDVESVKKAIDVVYEDKARLDKEIQEISNGKIASANATAQIKEYITERGIDIEGVTKGDVVDLLKDPSLPDDVRTILEIRQAGAKSSTAKLRAMLLRADKDGRVRNVHQYHGAGTGRWSGRGIQTQNLPRPQLKQEQIEGVIANLHKGPEYIDMFYGPPTACVSDCLRSFITAAPGKDLLVVDFAAIEARVLAWLAGQESILEVFRTHGKIYEAQAGGIYNVKMEDVTKDQRQIGKVAILALGYQGGVGAFQSMAENYGVKVSDARADEIKVAWRKANPQTVQYWYDLDNAAIQAVLNPGTKFYAGHIERQVIFLVSGSFLMCRLPSGRILYYPYPKLELNKFGRESVTYMGENPKTKKWERLSFYGGLAAENITQAVSRDLLAEAMLRLERKCYEVVMHVHDEIVCEVDEKFGTLNYMINIVCELPVWAKGLPIASEGFRTKRYRK